MAEILPNIKAVPAQVEAARRYREWRIKNKPKERHEVSLDIALSMFQQRMQAITLQDRKAVRRVFLKWDKRDKGSLSLADFLQLTSDLDIPMSAPAAEAFMAKFGETRGELDFKSFVHDILGLPHDFFDMDLMSHQGPSGAGAGEPKQRGPLLPRDTPIEKVAHLFKTRLRHKFFNVEAVISKVLTRTSTRQTFMVKDDLFLSLKQNVGIMPTDAELNEMLRFFDCDDDGKLNFYEFAHDLLGLPQPAGMKHMGQNRKKGATQLSQHTKHIVDKLIACAERAACPPSTLYSMFKCYDTDGSGCIAYDEMREMVRETECNIEGADMAALLLKHLSGGKGELAYNEFIQKVVGLPEGALRPEGNSTTRLCTAEATQKLAAGVKGTLYASPRAVHRVFSIFDDDNSGSIRASEFVQGLAKLRLPIRPNQAKAMFHELADTKGVLTQADFAARVLHAEGPEDRVARQFGSTVEKCC